MSGQVVSIKGESIPKNGVDENCVEILRDWLRMAEAGELHSVALVGVGPDQIAGTYWYRSGIHGIGQTNALIAGIEGLRFRMVAAGYA